jgi:hypothetical protein
MALSEKSDKPKKAGESGEEGESIISIEISRSES